MKKISCDTMLKREMVDFYISEHNAFVGSTSEIRRRCTRIHQPRRVGTRNLSRIHLIELLEGQDVRTKPHGNQTLNPSEQVELL